MVCVCELCTLEILISSWRVFAVDHEGKKTGYFCLYVTQSGWVTKQSRHQSWIQPDLIEVGSQKKHKGTCKWQIYFTSFVEYVEQEGFTCIYSRMSLVVLYVPFQLKFSQLHKCTSFLYIFYYFLLCNPLFDIYLLVLKCPFFISVIFGWIKMCIATDLCSCRSRYSQCIILINFFFFFNWKKA